MPAYQHNLPHLYVPIPDQGVSQKYIPPRRGGSKSSLPPRNREEHAEALKQACEKMIEEAQQQKLLREPELTIGESGVYVDFQIQAKEIGAVELENSRKKIELVAVRQSEDGDDLLSVTVFIPDQATDFFRDKIEAYRDQDTKKKLSSNRVTIIFLLLREIDCIAGLLLLREFTRGNPKNQALIARLENIQLSDVRQLFTDEPEFFPETDQDVWWEIWLRQAQLETFKQLAELLQIRTTEHSISFPERDVVLALTNAITLSRVIRNTGVIAELRLAKDSPSMFFEMDMKEQVAWVDDLLDRVIEPSDKSNKLAICLLDSGVTRTHRLIEIALAPKDVLTCNPLWGTADSQLWHGHGTSMAGILLYGDLLNAMAKPDKIWLSHRLESVKILPDRDDNDPDLYGAITQEAVYQAEINAPNRQRIICMAVTSQYETAQGKPSSWSSAIDQLCFGDRDLQEPQRLIVISIGNIRTDILPERYPDLNDVSQAENPAQAWNALVVGAYTDKVNISDRKYISWQPIAPAGDLSPRSRTSILWNTQWPIRPDVVMEGGNLATDGILTGMDVDDLQLLTTYYKPLDRQFNTFGDTSAATALVSHMAARIWAEYPRYLPETVRALIVHSAEWTPAMLKHLPKKPRQIHKCAILRRYGYGVPNLGKALQSAQNDLAMILEDDLQPFYKDGSTIKAKEMNLHQLPWPKNELEKLREAEVEMKVTLSYFVEPNPGERGRVRRHSYASHGLRFAVKQTLEELDDFKKRINREEREVEEDSPSIQDNEWFLGVQMQSLGSIHSDIWRGTAADLAQRDAVAVYPVGGWWKNNPAQRKWEQRARYSLIVSIRVLGDIETDIYTPIQNIIKQSTPIDI
ncbi:MAG: S8 family peptidase [Symploca sp. SIO3E6]|nr:S8 family peptidase [Caldora sp. SIO3E6]